MAGHAQRCRDLGGEMFKTIDSKLVALSLLALVLILLSGMASLGLGASNRQSSGDDTARAFMLASLGEVKEKVRADALQLLHAAKTGDMAAHAAAKTALGQHLKALSGGVAEPDVAGVLGQALAKLRAELTRYNKTGQELAALPVETLAAGDAQWAAFEASYNALQSSQNAASSLARADREGASLSADAAVQRAGMLRWLVVVFALMVFAGCAYAVYRSISCPLAHLRQVGAQVEGGAYDVRVNLRRQDELGNIGRAFDKLLDDRSEAIGSAAREQEHLNNSVMGLFTAMGALAEKNLTVHAPVTEDIIGTLGTAINQLTEVMATVLHHVTRISGVVEHASERVKQQSDVVNNMAKQEDVIVARLTANLETAMASMSEVAVLAGDSNQAAAEATRSTESAMHTVQATLSGMSQIRETISEMEKRIKRLGERSQEISQIVNLINTISERTHVLSLNAAMQAAMAGDAGRGFAVVAEEVQRLAENSRQATAQIANLVQNIQVETNDTIATVNKTIDQVVKESELAHNAGERMRETHEATARLVKLVATIANSSEEQTRIAALLRSAADEITQFTAQTAEQLAAQNQGAASLVAASKKLMESVSVFKLPPARG
jgi:methyl-accepting chemotaxis protein